MNKEIEIIDDLNDILEVVEEIEFEEIEEPVKKIKNEYFSNSQLLPVYIEWREKVLAARADGRPDDAPVMPNVLGAAIIKLATKITGRPNFVGYSYRDLMISDCIETICKYSTNFDPAKGKNLFAFWSMICWNASVNRIKIEQKQSRIKSALVQHLDLDSIIQQSDGDDHDIGQYIDMVRTHSTHDTTDYAAKLAEKKRKKLEKEALESDEIEDSGVMQFKDNDVQDDETVV